MTGLSFPTTVAPGLIEPLELIARMRHGDDAAFASLVSAYQPRVFRWAMALTGDADEADDITQEVFVRAYRKLGSFRQAPPSGTPVTLRIQLNIQQSRA